MKSHMGRSDAVITSAHVQIKLWRGASCAHTYAGHEDVVRHLALLPIGFISSSNDGKQHNSRSER